MDITNQLYDVIGEEEREISSFVPHPYNVTYVGADKMRADAKLIADIAQNGLIYKPRILRTPEGVDFILSGHRRLDALVQLGHKRATVEILVPREGVDVKRIIRSENGYRDRNERMRNVEACAFFADLESSSTLRKLKNLKGLRDALSADDDGAETIHDLAEQLGESLATLKMRKFVHYEPVMAKYFSQFPIPVEIYRERWIQIREANNDEELSISKAADMVRSLQKEFENVAATGKKKKEKTTAKPKHDPKQSKEEKPKPEETTVTFATRPNGLVWITTTEGGHRCGLILRDSIFTPAYEDEHGELMVIPWEYITTVQSY